MWSMDTVSLNWNILALPRDGGELSKRYGYAHPFVHNSDPDGDDPLPNLELERQNWKWFSDPMVPLPQEVFVAPGFEWHTSD